MTKEYISRDEMIEQTKARIVLGAPRFNTGLETAIEVATSIPAADVVEVRHGRWIEQSPDFDLCGVAYYQCSECGKEQQTPSNYCQFCGAKMDGGQDK